jgi:hypothetical protein
VEGKGGGKLETLNKKSQKFALTHNKNYLCVSKTLAKL